MDITRTVQAAVAGSQSWIGDPHLAPGTLAVSAIGVTAAVPDVTARLISMAERVFQARILGELLAVGTLRSVPRADIRAELVRTGGDVAQLAEVQDVKWRRIVGQSGKRVVLTPFTAVKAAFIAGVTAIGRDARLVHEGLDPKMSTDTTIRVRVGKGKGFVSWREANKADHIAVVIEALQKLPSDPTGFFEDMLESSHVSRDYRLGLHIVKVGFHPERACTPAWKALDEAAVKSRKRIARSFPDDVAAAKAAKERESKDGKDTKAGAGRPTLTSPSPRPHPAGKQPPAKKTKGVSQATKDKIMALDPTARSDADLRLLGLCLNCRQGSHSKDRCKFSKVAYTG
jgi:hypothetical protein